VPVTERTTGGPGPTGVPAASERARAGADAAILARLWGALAREPLPGIAGREVHQGTLTVWWSDGTRVTGDAAMAQLFAAPPPGFAVAVTAPGARQPEEVRDPGTLVRTLAPRLGRLATRLAAEVENSAANLALARAAQPEPDGAEPMLTRAARQPDPLAFLEQSVVDGHPVHPGARTRMGLSAEQVRAYAPEHRPAPVRLREVTIPPDRWYGVGSAPRLWLHPWQHDRLRDEHPWLSTVEREVPARPLLALRTLALVDDPRHHVKTSVDIQMTSAVRTVSPTSIHNGYVLSSLMADGRLAHPGLQMVPELGGGAVIVDGEPNRRLALIHRRLPALAPGELALPLAALTAPSLATGAPIVLEIAATGHGGDPMSFVEHFAGALLRPVVSLLGRGVALEAHGQNVLGVVRGGRLVRLLYRDVGGVRVSARRLREHGIEPPSLRGDIPSDDPEVLRTKVFASAVSTLLGEVIAVLARHTGLEADRAWERVAAAARTLDGPDVRHLFAETLPIKAMTAMRLADDATADLWCPVPNPMAGLG
jgi:Siderophore synthetase component